MRKKIIILVCFTLTSMLLSAQQDAQYTLFPWAALYYNPGTAGEQSNTLCFTGIFTNKYTAFKDNQYTATEQTTGNEDPDKFLGVRDFLMNVEFYSRKIRGAFGLSFVNDHLANYNNISIRLGYAYKMKIAGGTLGIGLQACLFNQAVDKTTWRVIHDNDPNIPAPESSEMNLDFSLGLHYRAETWNVGISAVNLLGNSSVSLSGEGRLSLARQLYIHGGYIWTLPWDPNWTLEPKVLIKTDIAAYQIDAAILTRYNGILWGGLSYRINDAVSILFGARPFYNSGNNYLKGLEVGVGYSFTTTKFGYTQRGSYGDIEVMVRYCFDIYKTETFFGYGNSRATYQNQY